MANPTQYPKTKHAITTEISKNLLILALETSNGVIATTAKLLDLTPASIHLQIKAFGLQDTVKQYRLTNKHRQLQQFNDRKETFLKQVYEGVISCKNG